MFKQFFSHIQLLLLSVAATVAYVYHNETWNGLSRDLHHQIISDTAEGPYRYRVLVPFLCEALNRPFEYFGYDALDIVYLLYFFAAISAFLFALHHYLQNWFTGEQATAGTLVAAILMSLALRDHFYQPWTLMEMSLMTLGLGLMLNRQNAALCVLTFVATLNRETTIFIPLIYLFATQGVRSIFKPRTQQQKRELLYAGTMFGIWAVTFVGLRLIRGYAPQVDTIEEMFTLNIQPHNLVQSLIHNALFLGVMGMCAAKARYVAPEHLRRVAAIVPLYLATIFINALWWEVRLLMPLFPVLMPLMMWNIYKMPAHSHATMKAKAEHEDLLPRSMPVRGYTARRPS